MAYVTKYHFTITDRLGVQTLVNLKLSGYSGADTLLHLGSISLELGQGKTVSVVRGSSAKISLWSLTQGQFSEFRDITDRKWMVEYLKGGSPYWYGWLTPEIFSEPFKQSVPYKIELTAIDGLGDLANQDYNPGFNITTGSTRISLQSIVYLCLNTSGISLPVCFSSTLRPSGTSGDPFTLAYYNNANFVDSKGIALKCSDVLERLFPFGITIKQWRGKWYVIRTADLRGPIFIYEYTTTGAFSSSYTLNLNNTIDDTSITLAGNLPVGQSGLMSQEQAYKQCLVNEDFGLKTSMLDNGSFTASGGAWTAPTGALTYETDKDVTFGYLSPKDLSGVTTGAAQTITVEASTAAFVFSLKVAPFGFQYTSTAGYVPLKLAVRFRVKLTGASATYYLDKTKGWVTASTYIDITDLYATHFGWEVNWNTVKITATGLPVAGDLEILLCKLPYMTIPVGGPTVTGVGYTEVMAYQIGSTYVASQELKAVNNTDYNYIPGEETLMLNDAPAVSNNKLMYRNYLSSATNVPTTTWSVDSITGSYPLIELFLRHTLSLHRRPLKYITMTIRGAVEWPGTMTDRDGNYYELVSAVLNDRECTWRVDLREILAFVDLGPIITVVSSSATATLPAGTGSAVSSTINPGLTLVRLDFTALRTPSVINYDADYANLHGQYPVVRLFTVDGSGNYQERSENPKFVMVSGLLDSIVYDLAFAETGYIILS